MSVIFIIAVIAAVILAAVAIAEGKNTMNKEKVIKRIYFYLVSLITLITLVVSIGFLLKSALTSTVFTQADQYTMYSVPPPELFLTDAKGLENSGSEILCEEGCEFTALQKEQVDSWVGEYHNWEEDRNGNSQKQRDIVTNLSLLLVALPLFIIHYRSVQKSAKNSTSEEKSHQVIRPTYFYIASLVGIVMIIIFGSMLINLGLRTYIITGADDSQSDSRYPVDVYSGTATNMASVKNCQTDCNLSDEAVALSDKFSEDYDTWQNQDTSSGHKQDEAANEIAFLLVAIPLFWYHWSVARKEGRENKS